MKSQGLQLAAEPTLHGFCLHELNAARVFPALAAADGLGLLRPGIRRANWLEGSAVATNRVRLR